MSFRSAKKQQAGSPGSGKPHDTLQLHCGGVLSKRQLTKLRPAGILEECTEIWKSSRDHSITTRRLAQMTDLGADGAAPTCYATELIQMLGRCV
jgi:hypothetical protein